MLYDSPEWVTSEAAQIERILARYPQKRSAVLPLLHLAQDQVGYIRDEDIAAIGEIIDETNAYVESVCSFYSMYKRKPKGKYHLVVCGNLSCGLCGSKELIKTLRQELGLDEFEVTADGLISYEVTPECLAACDQAPVLQCNVEYVVKCNGEKAKLLVDAIKRGEGPDQFIEFPLPQAVPAQTPAAETAVAKEGE